MNHNYAPGNIWIIIICFNMLVIFRSNMQKYPNTWKYLKIIKIYIKINSQKYSKDRKYPKYLSILRPNIQTKPIFILVVDIWSYNIHIICFIIFYFQILRILRYIWIFNECPEPIRKSPLQIRTQIYKYSSWGLSL